MTPVPIPTRVRDLPADQAATLRRIHAHTLDITRLRTALNTIRLGTPEQRDLSERLRVLERDRSLTEHHARTTGIPTTWIALAHQAGAAGQAWTGDQILPPPRNPGLRSGQRRVAVDTHTLVDMAALAVVREHLHTLHGIRPDTDGIEVRQFRHAMTSHWLRATTTAAAIGLTPDAIARVIETAGRDLTHKVKVYQHYSLPDINTLWRDYTRPQLTDQLRASLRDKPPATDTALPAPREWLATAHAALHPMPNEPEDYIAAALAAATTPTLEHPAEPDEKPPPLEPEPAPAVDAGPSP